MSNDRKVLGITLAAEGAEEIEKAFLELGKDGADAAKRIQQAFTSVDFKGDFTGTVKKELAGLGKAGEQAATKVNAALAKVGVGETFTARIARMKRALADFGSSAEVVGGFKNIRAGLDDMAAGFQRGITIVGAFSAAVGAAVAGAGLLANRASDTAEQIDNQAQAFGISFENMQKLRDTISEVGGDDGLLEKALTKFTAGVEGVGDAADGAEGKVGKFNGVTQSGIPGLLEYTRKLEAMGDTQKQLAQVTKDFGSKGAVTMLQFLRNFADKADEAKQAALGMLPPLDKIGQTNLLDLDQAGDRLSTNFSHLGLLLGSRIAPAFTALYNTIREIIGVVGQPLSEAIGAVASAAADEISKNKDVIVAAARSVVNQVAEITRNVVDAIRTLDTGDASTNWIIRLRDAAVSTFTFIRDAITKVIIPAFQVFSRALQPIASLINGLFGTDFSGNAIAAAIVVGQFTGVLGILTGALNVAAGAMRIFGAALLAGNPILAAIVIAVAAAAAIIYYNWDQIKVLGVEAWEEIKIGAEATFKAIVSGARAIADAAAGVWASVKIGAAATWETVTAGAEAMWTRLGDGWGIVSEAAESTWSRIATAAKATWDAIPRYFATSREVLLSAIRGLPALIAPVWETIKSGATTAWNTVVSGAQALSSRVAPALGAVRDALGSIWNGLTQAASAAWDTVTQTVQGAVNKVASAVGGLARSVLDAWSGASNDVVQASQAIVDAIQRASDVSGNVQGAADLAAQLVAPFQQAAEAINGIFGSIAASVGALAQQVVNSWAVVPEQMTFAAQAMVSSWSSAMSNVINSTTNMVAMVRGLISGLSAQLASLQSSIASAKAQAASSGSSGLSGGGGRGFSWGGLARGPGTGTSDSIPARLSAGEYVLRAAAVNRLPLEFLHALNSARFDLSEVLNRFMHTPLRFAGGGLVPQAPRLSLAGVSAGPRGGISSPVTLVIGGEKFTGFNAGQDAIQRLDRAMKHMRLTSGGRPNPYGY